MRPNSRHVLRIQPPKQNVLTFIHPHPMKWQGEGPRWNQRRSRAPSPVSNQPASSDASSERSDREILPDQPCEIAESNVDRLDDLVIDDLEPMDWQPEGPLWRRPRRRPRSPVINADAESDSSSQPSDPEILPDRPSRRAERNREVLEALQLETHAGRLLRKKPVYQARIKAGKHFCGVCGTFLLHLGYRRAMNSHGPGTFCNVRDWTTLTDMAALRRRADEIERVQAEVAQWRRDRWGR